MHSIYMKYASKIALAWLIIFFVGAITVSVFAVMRGIDDQSKKEMVFKSLDLPDLYLICDEDDLACHGHEDEHQEDEEDDNDTDNDFELNLNLK